MAKLVIKNPKTVLTDLHNNSDSWILGFIVALVKQIEEEPFTATEEYFEEVATDIINAISNEVFEIAEGGLPAMQEYVDSFMGPTEAILDKLIKKVLGV